MARRVPAVLVLVLVAVVAIRLVVGLVVGFVSAVLWILVVAALVAAGLWARPTREARICSSTTERSRAAGFKLLAEGSKVEYEELQARC